MSNIFHLIGGTKIVFRHGPNMVEERFAIFFFVKIGANWPFFSYGR